MSAAPVVPTTNGAIFRATLNALWITIWDLFVHQSNSYTTGGTSTAFTLTPTPALSANTALVRYNATFNQTATGTPTLAVSGNAALPIMAFNVSGTLVNYLPPVNLVSDIVCDGSHWIVLNAPDVSSGVVTAAALATLLSGQTMNIAGSSTSCSGNAATATTSAACSGNTAGSSSSCTGNAATATTTTSVGGLTGIGVATPLVESGSGAVGTSTLAARQDHVHPAQTSAGRLINIQTFTAGGTYTKATNNPSFVVVEVRGADGSPQAPSAVASLGGGGGGGGYSRMTIANASLLASETVTVAASQAASSSFGAHCSATGGGNASASAPGAGGTGSGGNANIAGTSGQPGYWNNTDLVPSAMGQTGVGFIGPGSSGYKGIVLVYEYS